MSIENVSYARKSYNAQKNINKGVAINATVTLPFKEGLDLLLESEDIKNLNKSEIDRNKENKNKNDVIIKDKVYFRKLYKEAKQVVENFVMSHNYSFAGMDTGEFIKRATDEYKGYSILAPLYEDDKVTDIFIMGYDRIFYESSDQYNPVRYDKSFDNENHLKLFIERLMKAADGKPLDVGDNKIADFELYNDRYNSIHPIVSPRGFTLTIRKHSEDHIQLKDLRKAGCVNDRVEQIMKLSFLAELNGIVGGITGSGKTTTLRAFLDDTITETNKRMLVCEDTRELVPKSAHTLELQTLKSKDPNLSVELTDLLILALRQKPKHIIVGEVRGLEAMTMIEAAQTGHSTWSTMHGDKPRDILNRIALKYLSALPSIGFENALATVASSLDLICIQKNIKNTGRRITSITEFGYDYDNKKVLLNEVVKYDPRKKDFIINKFSRDTGEKMLLAGLDESDLEGYVDWDLKLA